MIPGFWNFGGGKGAIIPPAGPFAPATTAVTTNYGSSSIDEEMRDATSMSGHENGSTRISIPNAAQQAKGKLKVRISEARGLTVNERSNPYVVVACSSSEHVSRSANVPDPTGIAIPSRSSQPRLAMAKRSRSNPEWKDEAQFDVTRYADIEVSVYDAGNDDKFLGWCTIRPDFSTSHLAEGWYRLKPRVPTDHVAGEVHVSFVFEQTPSVHYGPNDFEKLRLIGKGTFGTVYQVRKKDTKRVYAMKVLSKKIIVQKKEVAHTIGERDILVRTSGGGKCPFLLGLKFAFQTATDLYLVTDYMSGGELFWHLQREGRFAEARAKFYIAELIVALKHLHDNDIVYRDLKPENILLDASGHIALCDFGLSKANLHNGTTNTFCGTTEYLAPEVLLDDKGYTKMVDFWSLGVLIFEMCCGWSPFYASDSQQMYKNIAFGKVRFPKDALSPEGRDFVKGLLNRNPKHRLGATNDALELMSHPFFKDIDFEMLKRKQIPPPYKPHVSSEDDTSNFDPEFTGASLSREFGGTPLSPGMQDKFQGFTFVDDTFLDNQYGGRSLAPQSFRPPPPKDGIDLYDENDIKLSQSFYDSGIKHKFAGRGDTKRSPSPRPAPMEEDEHMNEDEGEDMFVTSQGFEI